jgi:hypothetical protein
MRHFIERKGQNECFCSVIRLDEKLRDLLLSLMGYESYPKSFPAMYWQ